MRAIGGHHQPNRGLSDDWLTPPEIITALGRFDLDPCCPSVMPWRTADKMLHWPTDDGLSTPSWPWFGRVWMNPPYGPDAAVWLERLAMHGDGIALILARTETRWFFSEVWEKASAVLFLKGRLHFHRPDGTRAKANAGAGSVLVAYGDQNAETLRSSGLAGRFIQLR